MKIYYAGLRNSYNIGSCLDGVKLQIMFTFVEVSPSDYGRGEQRHLFKHMVKAKKKRRRQKQ